MNKIANKKRVEEAIKALLADGEKPSIRAVHRMVGGRWETVKALYEQVDMQSLAQSQDSKPEQYPWGLTKPQVDALYAVLRENARRYLVGPGEPANLAETAEIQMLMRQNYAEMEEELWETGCKTPRDHVRRVPLNKHFDYEDGGRWITPSRAWLTLILSESQEPERKDFDHAQSFEINVPKIQELVIELLRDGKIPPRFMDLATSISNWPTTL